VAWARGLVDYRRAVQEVTMSTEIEELGRRLAAGETLPAEDLEVLGLDDRFGDGTVGLVWETFALDRVTARLEPDARHHQPHGLVHGGVWCTVEESMASFGAALRAGLDGDVVVGVSNTTDFLRPHRTGTVEAVAEPIHVGRTQQLWQVVLTRADDGKTVARGQVRLQHLRRERVDAGGGPS
jgi:uncharacterized protein (TIGR00369 family)